MEAVVGIRNCVCQVPTEKLLCILMQKSVNVIKYFFPVLLVKQLLESGGSLTGGCTRKLGLRERMGGGEWVIFSR